MNTIEAVIPKGYKVPTINDISDIMSHLLIKNHKGIVGIEILDEWIWCVSDDFKLLSIYLGGLDANNNLICKQISDSDENNIKLRVKKMIS